MDAIRGLGANQTEKAITCVGKALRTLSPVLDQYDKVNMVQSASTIRSIPKCEKDRDVIMQQLQVLKLFLVHCSVQILFFEDKLAEMSLAEPDCFCNYLGSCYIVLEINHSEAPRTASHKQHQL